MVYKNKNITVSLKVPYIGDISGTWEPDEQQINASWELYVELSTRVAVVELKEEEGLLREAFNSLFSLFAVSRDILKKYGPSVAIPNQGNLSFGYLTVRILNEIVRPFLSKWHPTLCDYEEKRDPTVTRMEHEKNWELNNSVREELNFISKVLYQYSLILAEVAGIPSLIERQEN